MNSIEQAQRRTALVAESLRQLEAAKASNAGLPEPSLPEFRTIHLPQQGMDVAYRDIPARGDAEGADGRTFLLLHGLGGSSANWESVVEKVSQHGRVVIPDLPGFGRTEVTAEHADVQSLVASIAEFLRCLGITRVVIAGNSMGGLIAALLAGDEDLLAQIGVIVERVVLIDPVLPIDWRNPPAPMVMATFSMYRLRPLARLVVPWYAGRIGLERMGIDGVVGQTSKPLRVPKWVVRRAVEETFAHSEREHAVATLVSAASSLTSLSMKPSYRAKLARLRGNVTLLHGEQDRMVQVSAARKIAQAHPHWRYVEARDVGHVPMFEVADWVAWEVVQEA